MAYRIRIRKSSELIGEIVETSLSASERHSFVSLLTFSTSLALTVGGGGNCFGGSDVLGGLSMTIELPAKVEPLNSPDHRQFQCCLFSVI